MKENNFKSLINENMIKPASAEEDENDAQNAWISDFILATFQTFFKQVRILRKIRICAHFKHSFMSSLDKRYIGG